MAHSVILTTPIPTWEETAERYGLSKADRRFVASLFGDKGSRRSTASKARSASIRVKTNNAKKSSGRVRKTRSRAR
jgi:hypothetical protein